MQVFKHNDKAGWVQIGQDLDGEAGGNAGGDGFGFSVSLSSDGTQIVAGAIHYGYAQVYNIDSSCFSLRTQEPAMFVGLEIEFVGIVEELGQQDSLLFAQVTEGWFKDFFKSNSGTGAFNMTMVIQFVSQSILTASIADGRPSPVSTITYNQTIEYILSVDASKPEQYIMLPFLSMADNRNYGAHLMRILVLSVIFRPPLIP